MKSFKFPIILISIIYIIIITSVYVSLEQNIYYWDFKSYWIYWQNLSENIFKSPKIELIHIIHSMNYDDYNLCPVIILVFFKFLPVSSRLAYILSINLLYLLPVAIVFSLLQSKILNVKNVRFQFFSYILAITFVPFWAPSLRGYPDICGLFFIILSIWLCLTNNLSKQIDVKNSLKLGLCLWLAFLLRRWYVFTVIALYLTLPVITIFYHKAKLDTKTIKNVVLNFFMAGMTNVILSMLFQWHLIKRILQTNYTHIYSAYQTPLFYSIYSEILTGGYLFFILTCCLSLIVLLRGATKSKILVIFSWSNLIISFALFTHTQSPGMHQSIPFEFWLLLAFSQGILFIFNTIKSEKQSVWVMTILSIILILIQINSLFGIYQNNFLNKMLPNMNLPLKVSNYQEYIHLAQYLENLTKNNDKVSIFSSNSNLNGDIISNLTNFKIDNNLTYVSQVDLRDGFSPDSIMSKYVVITDPVQLHLNPSGQRVISIPVLDILNKHNIGKAYVKIGRSYNLNDSVTASIYKKNRNFTIDEVNGFLSEFYQYYPEWKKNLSEQKLKLSFLNSAISKGDVWGQFELQSDGSIYAHPGATLPTIIDWTLVNIDKLIFTSLNTSCNKDDSISIELMSSNNKILHFYLKKGEISEINVSDFKNVNSKMIIKKVKDSGCDAISISTTN